jgi:predicted MFS family arabinose efflux permease
LKVVVPEHVVVHQGIWHSLVKGGEYIVKEPGIRVCMFLSASICAFGYTYMVLLAVINKYILHGTEASYGQLAGLNGLGSLVGALITVYLGERVSQKAVVIIGHLMLGLSVLVLSQMTSSMTASACVFFAGFGFMLAFTTLRSSMLHIASDDKKGTVMGFIFSFFFGGMMLSSIIVVPLADHFGLPSVLAFCGVALLIQASVTPFLKGVEELK